jgi:hypothetical protein
MVLRVAGVILEIEQVSEVGANDEATTSSDGKFADQLQPSRVINYKLAEILGKVICLCLTEILLSDENV